MISRSVHETGEDCSLSQKRKKKRKSSIVTSASGATAPYTQGLREKMTSAHLVETGQGTVVLKAISSEAARTTVSVRLIVRGGWKPEEISSLAKVLQSRRMEKVHEGITAIHEVTDVHAEMVGSLKINVLDGNRAIIRFQIERTVARKQVM